MGWFPSWFALSPLITRSWVWSRSWEGGGPAFSCPARGLEGVLGGGFVITTGPSGIHSNSHVCSYMFLCTQ